MEKMVPNETLHHHVTGSVFALTLSRHMIHALDAVAHNDYQHSDTRDFVNPAHRLIARGLVQHRGRTLLIHGTDEMSYAEMETGIRRPLAKEVRDHWRLTRAGWLMHDLLAEAGMVAPIPPKSPLRKYVHEVAMEQYAAKMQKETTSA